MSTCFSCFELATGIMKKKYLVYIKTTYSSRYSFLACNSPYAWYSLECVTGVDDTSKIFELLWTLLIHFWGIWHRNENWLEPNHHITTLFLNFVLYLKKAAQKKEVKMLQTGAILGQDFAQKNLETGTYRVYQEPWWKQ